MLGPLKDRWNELYRSIQDADVKEAILNKNYTEAIDLCRSINEEKAAIELFLLDIINPENHQDWAKIDYEEIKEAIPILVRICSEVGIREARNPFIKFVKLYKDQTGRAPKENNIIINNNAYADRITSYDDLIGKGADKTKHLIFNQNLYSLEKKDAEYLLDVYKWLSNPRNIKSMNLKELDKRDFPSSYRDLYTIDIKDDASTKDIRDILIYKDPKNVKTSALQSPYMIEKALKASSVGQNPSNKEDDLDQNERGFENLEVYKDAFAALKSVGYKENDIRRTLSYIRMNENSNSADVVVKALKMLKRI